MIYVNALITSRRDPYLCSLGKLRLPSVKT